MNKSLPLRNSIEQAWTPRQPPRQTKSFCQEIIEAHGQVSTVNGGGCESGLALHSVLRLIATTSSPSPHSFILGDFCRVLELLKAVRCVQTWQTERPKKGQRIYPQPSALSGCIRHYR